ncbi:hypothetical protein HZH68_013521 [Vespula germanica]|uniref:Uncharacterized protein n=1 Tax=Vespula germanica TaxID=30212 RepID=A0A834MWM7_VESGE|nr:hypothetical protein HZH68_013521 [Vespula germanica]
MIYRTVSWSLDSCQDIKVLVISPRLVLRKEKGDTSVRLAITASAGTGTGTGTGTDAGTGAGASDGGDGGAGGGGTAAACRVCE